MQFEHQLPEEHRGSILPQDRALLHALLSQSRAVLLLIVDDVIVFRYPTNDASSMCFDESFLQHVHAATSPELQRQQQQQQNKQNQNHQQQHSASSSASAAEVHQLRQGAAAAATGSIFGRPETAYTNTLCFNSFKQNGTQSIIRFGSLTLVVNPVSNSSVGLLNRSCSLVLVLDQLSAAVASEAQVCKLLWDFRCALVQSHYATLFSSASSNTDQSSSSSSSQQQQQQQQGAAAGAGADSAAATSSTTTEQADAAAAARREQMNIGSFVRIALEALRFLRSEARAQDKLNRKALLATWNAFADMALMKLGMLARNDAVALEELAAEAQQQQQQQQQAQQGGDSSGGGGGGGSGGGAGAAGGSGVDGRTTAASGGNSGGAAGGGSGGGGGAAAGSVGAGGPSSSSGAGGAAAAASAATTTSADGQSSATATEIDFDNENLILGAAAIDTELAGAIFGTTHHGYAAALPQQQRELFQRLTAALLKKRLVAISRSDNAAVSAGLMASMSAAAAAGSSSSVVAGGGGGGGGGISSSASSPAASQHPSPMMGTSATGAAGVNVATGGAASSSAAAAGGGLTSSAPLSGSTTASPIIDAPCSSASPSSPSPPAALLIPSIDNESDAHLIEKLLRSDFRLVSHAIVLTQELVTLFHCAMRLLEVAVAADVLRREEPRAFYSCAAAPMPLRAYLVEHSISRAQDLIEGALTVGGVPCFELPIELSDILQPQQRWAGRNPSVIGFAYFTESGPPFINARVTVDEVRLFELAEVLNGKARHMVAERVAIMLEKQRQQDAEEEEEEQQRREKKKQQEADAAAAAAVAEAAAAEGQEGTPASTNTAVVAAAASEATTAAASQSPAEDKPAVSATSEEAPKTEKKQPLPKTDDYYLSVLVELEARVFPLVFRQCLVDLLAPPAPVLAPSSAPPSSHPASLPHAPLSARGKAGANPSYHHQHSSSFQGGAPYQQPPTHSRSQSAAVVSFITSSSSGSVSPVTTSPLSPADHHQQQQQQSGGVPTSHIKRQHYHPQRKFRDVDLHGLYSALIRRGREALAVEQHELEEAISLSSKSATVEKRAMREDSFATDAPHSLWVVGATLFVWTYVLNKGEGAGGFAASSFGGVHHHHHQELSQQLTAFYDREQRRERKQQQQKALLKQRKQKHDLGAGAVSGHASYHQQQKLALSSSSSSSKLQLQQQRRSSSPNSVTSAAGDRTSPSSFAAGASASTERTSTTAAAAAASASAAGAKLASSVHKTASRVLKDFGLLPGESAHPSAAAADGGAKAITDEESAAANNINTNHSDSLFFDTHSPPVYDVRDAALRYSLAELLPSEWFAATSNNGSSSSSSNFTGACPFGATPSLCVFCNQDKFPRSVAKKRDSALPPSSSVSTARATTPTTAAGAGGGGGGDIPASNTNKNERESKNDPMSYESQNLSWLRYVLDNSSLVKDTVATLAREVPSEMLQAWAGWVGRREMSRESELEGLLVAEPKQTEQQLSAGQDEENFTLLPPSITAAAGTKDIPAVSDSYVIPHEDEDECGRDDSSSKSDGEAAATDDVVFHEDNRPRKLKKKASNAQGEIDERISSDIDVWIETQRTEIEARISRVRARLLRDTVDDEQKQQQQQQQQQQQERSDSETNAVIERILSVDALRAVLQTVSAGSLQGGEGCVTVTALVHLLLGSGSFRHMEALHELLAAFDDVLMVSL